MKILIGDDDKVIAHLLGTVLRQHGFQVIVAFDAMQVMMLAMRAPHPDAIILDLGMPGGSGIQTLKRLKLSSKTALIPIVVLSGSADPAHPKQVTELGAVEFVAKPVDPDAMLRAVQSALGVPQRVRERAATSD